MPTPRKTPTYDATRQLESIWLVVNTPKTAACLVLATSARDASDTAALLGMDSIGYAVPVTWDRPSKPRLNTIIHRPALGHSDPGGSTTDSSRKGNHHGT